MTPSDPVGASVGFRSSPLRWVPTLYFFQGFQFFVVMLVAGLMFKNMGVPNDQNARWTAVIGLAWAIKPLWSPFLELIKSKKMVVVAMEAIVAVCMALIALCLQLPGWFAACIAVMFVLAYAAATHDIAADGLYMASLTEKQQSSYAGWQTTFFVGSRFVAMGGLMVLAGHMETRFGVFQAWTYIFLMLALMMASLAAYNARFLPGKVHFEHEELSVASVWSTVKQVIVALLAKPGIWFAFAFIVLFRFAEGQVQTIGPLFLKDSRAEGGLGLSTEQIGAIYGGIGTAGFLLGSVLSGHFISWFRLSRAMPILILAMSLPNVVFYYLSLVKPAVDDQLHISLAIALEMFGYGFGFVGLILYIMQVFAPGPFRTAHYALGTGVMQLGFLGAKAVSGDIQVRLGYQDFFLWTIVCGLPILVMLFWVRYPAEEESDTVSKGTTTNSLG
jgi:PAT family beta-lactamase induction signal transducer AmpG